MNTLQVAPTRDRFERTVQALCPLIEGRIKTQVANVWTEYDLRREVVGCILGSQVRHEMAIASLRNIEHAGLLDNRWWSGSRDADFGSIVFDVLSGQKDNLPHRGCYRFYKVRAHQLTQTRDALAQIPLVVRLATSKVPQRLRQSLVVGIPGLGPKQASMFLRNIGMSYDLAILDTHVLRFMQMQNLLSIDQARLSTVSGYERIERVIVNYANTLGYPVGYLDWAIWATMKAARELGL